MKTSIQVYTEIFDLVTKSSTSEEDRPINGVGEKAHSTHKITFHNQLVNFRADTAVDTITKGGFTKAVITTKTLSSLVNEKWRKLYTRTITQSTYNPAEQSYPKPEVVDEVFIPQEELSQLLCIEQENINMKLVQTIKAQEKKIAELEDKLVQILKILG
jgi:uncharacterized protein YbaP (TraB family)